MERGGQAQTNITAFNNSVASGMICTVWIQLPAGAGVSTFILSQDLGDGIWLDLPTFNLAAGLNQYVSPVLAAFKVKGRINTTNAALVIWHAQMAGY